MLAKRQHRLEREMLKYAKGREKTITQKTDKHRTKNPPLEQGKFRKRPKHGENRWIRELILSTTSSSPPDSQHSSTNSEDSCSSTNSLAIGIDFTQKRPCSPLPSISNTTTSPTRPRNIPTITVTDAELLTTTPNYRSGELQYRPSTTTDYMHHVKAMSTSMPTLLTKETSPRQKTEHRPKRTPSLDVCSVENKLNKGAFRLPKIQQTSHLHTTQSSTKKRPFYL